MSTPFVSLHVHSEYSLLDGLSKVKDLIKRAKELNHPAIALTDHGVMHGAVELYRNALQEGVKPIIGCEAYLRDFGLTSRLKDFSGDGDYKVKDRYHQLILAINPTGYKNLCKLTSIAHLGEGRGAKTSTQETSTKHKGWVTLSELEQYSEGLIVTSGCMAGIIPQTIKAGSPELADQMIAWYKTRFGDRFYIEIQDHAANDGSGELNLKLVELAQKHQIPIVATADNHYTSPCDKSVHDALLCINTKKLLSDTKRMRYEGAYWLPTGDEMLERLSAYLPYEVALEAIENTVKLAERVEDYQLKRKPTPPKFVWLNGFDNADDYLEELAYTGLRNRFYGVPPQNYVERLQEELDVFRQKDLAEYFLVVWDICKFCRDNGILLGAGRGSAAGSLVSYALQITNIDPIHFGLIFSRFINVERMSYPDIDLDIEKERRHEVVRYLQEKYGSTQVAQIATFGKMVSASALKDTGRVLNVNYGAANELSRQIPVVRGKPAKISEMIKDRAIYPEFYDAYQVDQKMPNKDKIKNISFKKWVDIAIGIEGTVKSVGVHAAGVVIGWTALDEIIPLMKAKDGGAVSQYAMEDLEYLGLLKMDLLGLKTLTVVRKTIEAVKRITGETIDVESINLNDQAVLRSLANSDCAGVFQFEADGAVRLLKQIKPTSIDDVSAITSLNRPGCLDLGMHTDYARRKAGLEPITYLVPELKPILDFTYGLCVFQEQMLNICHKIAGFSLGKSDIARKSCLSGDTIINLSDGYRTTLRDFVRDFYAFSSPLIGSLDANTYREVEGEVVDAFFNGYRDVYQITTKTGRKIKATTNHQFFKLDQWISIDEGLKVGDSIAVPTELNVRDSVKTSSMSDHLIKACAYLIGDGHIGKKEHKRQAYFCNSDEWLLNDFARCLVREWNIKPRIVYQQASHQPNPIGYVYLTPSQRAFFARQIGYGVSGDRHIPDWVWELDRRQLKVFLGALWCTDGCFSVEGNDPRNQGEYASTSLDLIEVLQECFLKLGIVTTFNKKIQKYKGLPYVSYRLWVSGKEDVFSFYRELKDFLCPNKLDQLKKAYAAMSVATDNFSKYCVPNEVLTIIKNLKPENKSWRGLGIESGFGKDLGAGINFSNPVGQRNLSRKKVGAFAKALDNQKLRRLATSDVLWDKITSIEYVGVEDVYDLTIDHYANFIANGFYVHNCGKKKAELIKPLEIDFIQGCTDKWIDEDVAAQLWQIVLASAGYTFNASHAYCYSILTMTTAWLKYYYQAPFMAAMMSAEEDGDKLTDYLLKARSYGITLFEPSINRSQKDFTCLDDSTIMWGLRAIAGVGDTAINAILLERHHYGFFKSWEDFISRVNIGSDVLTALIKSGALDCFGLNRRQMIEHIELLKEWKKKDNAREKRLQNWTKKATDLQIEQSTDYKLVQKKLTKLEEISAIVLELSKPLLMPGIPDVEEYPLIVNLRGEKEVLGLYASGHPLDSYKVGCNPFYEVVKNKLFISTVLVSSVREANSKSGKMAYCTIEDKEGATMTLKVFNAQWTLYKSILKPDAILSITAKAQEWQGRLELILQVALVPTKSEPEPIAEDDDF